MLPYWILFSVYAFGALQVRSQPRPGSRPAPLLLLVAFATALMIGLRFEVGGDWIIYIEMFDRIAYFDLETTLAYDDPGYALVNWVASRAGMEIWAVNLVCALIFTWGLVRFAKEQPNPWLAVLVAVPYLIIVIAMGYTRQAVAIGIILAGMAKLDRATLGRFSIYILFAASFHKTAILVLPLIALAAATQRFITTGLLLVCGVILYYLFLDAALDRMMINYIEREMTSEGATIRVIMSIVPAAIYLLFRKRFQETFQLSDMQAKMWRNLSFTAIALLALLLTTTASTAIDRIALYLIPLQIFVWSRLPNVFPNEARPNNQLLLVLIVYSAIIQFVWLNYAAHSEFWIPYQIYSFEKPY